MSKSKYCNKSIRKIFSFRAQDYSCIVIFTILNLFMGMKYFLIENITQICITLLMTSLQFFIISFIITLDNSSYSLMNKHEYIQDEN